MSLLTKLPTEFSAETLSQWCEIGDIEKLEIASSIGKADSQNLLVLFHHDAFIIPLVYNPNYIRFIERNHIKVKKIEINIHVFTLPEEILLSIDASQIDSLVFENGEDDDFTDDIDDEAQEIWVNFLNHCPNLKSIDLQNNKMFQAEWLSEADSDILNRLESFSCLDGDMNTIVALLTEHCTAFTKLELIFTGTEEETPNEESILDLLRENKHITHLQLETYEAECITANTLQFILSHYPALESLQLRALETIDSDLIMNLLRDLKQLTKFSLYHTNYIIDMFSDYSIDSDNVMFGLGDALLLQCEENFDHHLLRIFDVVKNRTMLQLNDQVELTTGAINTIAMNNPHLKRLNLSTSAVTFEQTVLLLSLCTELSELNIGNSFSVADFNKMKQYIDEQRLNIVVC